jgi:hypothetical protein
MNEPFDDPEIRAQMARLGIVHKPGMANELMQQLAPLLAAEGVDLDDPDFDAGTFDTALARATEQHNLLLATPIGAQRAGVLTMLRLFTSAIADGDDSLARGLLSSIGPEPDGDAPAISHVIGVSLGLLDTWSTDLSTGPALDSARPPRWQGRPARAAATDVLSLARKGRAFDSQGSLIMRHHGLAVYEGGCLAVAASVIARAAREGVTVDAVARRILTDDADASAWSPLPAVTGQPAGASQPGSAFRKPRAAAAEAAPDRTDAAIAREFGAWLRQQPGMAADAVRAEVRVFEALLGVARDMGLDLREPEDLADLVDALYEDDDAPEEQPLAPALDTLDDYLHFNIETADDPSDWLEVHEGAEEAFADIDDDFREAIDSAIAGSRQFAPEQVGAALAQTRVVAAVGELLDWLGKGRPATSTGGLRRTDIQHVAGLLGISAIGVSKRPHPTEEMLDTSESATIHAHSMWDVPLLAAWWEALSIAGIIETTSTRVRPGPASATWSAAQPPLDVAEMVVGMFVARVLSESDWLPISAESLVSVTVHRLLRAIAPDRVEAAGLEVLDEADELGMWWEKFAGEHAQRTLHLLQSVGLLELDGDHAAVVPVELRGTVARGILLTMALAVADEQLE